MKYLMDNYQLGTLWTTNVEWFVFMIMMQSIQSLHYIKLFPVFISFV